MRIKNMFKVYWLLFLATGLTIFATIQQLICGCLYLEIGGLIALGIMFLFVVTYTSSMRKKVKR